MTPADPVGAAAIAPSPRRPAPWLWTSVRTLATMLVVLGVVTLACPGLLGAWSARADGAIPRSIDLAWRWQASLLDDPTGAAAVLASTGAGDPLQLVGRNGGYRSLYGASGRLQAGENAHLSPDGRWLALPYLDDPTTARRGPTLIDLDTGRTQVVAADGLPAHDDLTVLGWRPDGGALLLATASGPTSHLSLLRLAGDAVGRVTVIATVSTPAGTGQWRAAFSPDGRRVSFATGGSLHLVDDQGTPLWTVPLADGQELAGGGAFTLDGDRIALVQQLPCMQPCEDAAPSWGVTYVDTATGAEARGPVVPPIAAARVRALGWRPGADGRAALVVVRYLPRPTPPAVQGPNGELTAPPVDRSRDDGTNPADLYELAPGAPARLLLDAPYDVTDLDVPADLLHAGRFHGRPSMPSLLPIEPGHLRLLDIAFAVAVLGGLAVVVAIVVNLTGRIRPPRRWGLSSAGAGTGR